ncbi:MAG: rod shape-determining protein MreD [Clostridiales bacterium GWB2_37_7]|nr:MAG: rod shape-determining protein MreD [Clostridiales bacterium GWB2_37_7]
MKTLVVSVLVLLNLVLETTLFQFLRIGGIKPDFVIMLIVSYAILEGGAFSAGIGLTSGLLIDILFGRILGVNAFSYMITGYILGQAHENVFKDSILPPALFNFAAVIVYQHIYFLIIYLTGNLMNEGISYTYILFRIILPQGIYNAVFGAIIYRFLLHLNEKKFMQNRLY